MTITMFTSRCHENFSILASKAFARCKKLSYDKKKCLNGDKGGNEMEEKKLHHFKCLLCGYIVEIEDEELPEDYVCPLCGAPASDFEKID